MPARPPYSTRTLRYVRQRALANMLGQVRVLHVVPPVYDENTLVATGGVATVLYSGRARIYTEQASAAIFTGEAVIQTGATIISLPYNAAVPKVDDIVIVDSFGADTDLEDDVFSITDVGGGGLMRATRQLSVKAYRANRWWEA
jgi:hypothetical protein